MAGTLFLIIIGIFPEFGSQSLQLRQMETATGNQGTRKHY